MTESPIINIISDPNFISYGITALIGSFTAYYTVFRRKLNKFRKFIDMLDDANADNNITAEEFTGIFKSGKELLK